MTQNSKSFPKKENCGPDAEQNVPVTDQSSDLLSEDALEEIDGGRIDLKLTTNFSAISAMLGGKDK